MKLRTTENISQCRELWRRYVPQDCFFNLWEVRECFHLTFGNEPFFVTAEENGVLCGLLALCRNGSGKGVSFFPGELYGGRTWLEQNVIYASSHRALETLLGALPNEGEVRYLRAAGGLLETFCDEDELNYSLLPPALDYDFDRYLAGMDGKYRRNLLRELRQFDAEVRLNNFADIDAMLDLNLQNFGSHSYFADSRFLAGFRRMLGYARYMEALRVTTMLVDGQIAAVDVGVTHANRHTVLAGGTNPLFKGIAKHINIHHIKWALESRLGRVDFLCGDFGWKDKFALHAEPLYKLSREKIAVQLPVAEECMI
ncbi:MAG: GNAT family N-acetyltransferase [Phycisphaerae bacterium]|jgi:hypothetical protein